jgi:hypothetical protein
MSVKLTLRGPRLGGNYVCLLDGPWDNIVVNQADSGNINICNRLVWPPPRNCKILTPTNPVIAEFPFDVLRGHYLEFWDAVEPGKYFSRAAAWDAAMAAEVREEEYPDSLVFYLTLLGGTYPSPDGSWTAGLWHNLQRMMFDASVLNPGWKGAADIEFYIAFKPPDIPGVPPFFKIALGGGAWPIGSPEVHIGVDHETIYEGIAEMEFAVVPTKFSLKNLDTLPSWDGYTRGFNFSRKDLFNLRVQVRRGVPEFEVKWTDEEVGDAEYAVMRHRGTGQIMGPPIRLGDLPGG